MWLLGLSALLLSLDAYAAPLDFPIGVQVNVIKPSKLFKFVSRGSFVLPDRMIDNPVVGGGSLSFVGTTGGKT